MSGSERRFQPNPKWVLRHREKDPFMIPPHDEIVLYKAGKIAASTAGRDGYLIRALVYVPGENRAVTMEFKERRRAQQWCEQVLTLQGRG